MFGLFDSGLCPIGIDLGTHAIRLLQFRAKEESLSLQAACRIEFDSIDSSANPVTRFASALRHAFSSQKFSGRQVVLSLPVSLVHAKSVRLPQMPDSDLSQALVWEAKDRFGFEIGDGRLVWFRAGEVRRGTEVKDELLLFAVEGAPLAQYIDALAAAGLTVAAIDLAPCALYRAAQRSFHGPVPEIRAILDIGHAGSQFLITRQDELVFYKHIEIGGSTINDAVAGKLGVTPAEASQMRARLASDAPDAEQAGPLSQALKDAMRTPLEELSRELDMCMRYFVVTFRGSRPDFISVYGRQASSPQIRETLASALGIQLEEAQPLRGVLELGDSARPDRSGEWGLAAGLSLYPIRNVSQEVAA